MDHTSNSQTIAIFPLFIGGLAILFGLFDRQLLRVIGFKPLSEVFTTPHFRRSAKITGKLGRLFLVVFGAGFLVQGAGTLFLSNEVIYAVSTAILGTLAMIILATLSVVFANWRVG